MYCSEKKIGMELTIWYQSHREQAMNKGKLSIIHTYEWPFKKNDGSQVSSLNFSFQLQKDKV